MNPCLDKALTKIKLQRNILFTTIYLLFSSISISQNLVPNGGFETFTSLPNAHGQFFKATGWTNVNGNTTGPPYGSPDYYNTLGSFGAVFGPISPNSGNGQMGICTYHGAPLANYREYLSIPLTSPLIPGHQYEISFYLTNGNGGIYTGTVDNFGIHLSTGPLTQLIAEVIQLTPTIEIIGVISNQNYWQHYTYSFVATNAASQITFGNFEMDNTTTIVGGSRAYYFIDDIELVTTTPSLQIQGNTYICEGDSTTLSAINDTIFTWVDSINPMAILSTDSIITVAPNVTTTYLVYGTNDSTSVTVNVYNFPMINLSNDTALCLGETLTLDATIPNATYLWQDNSTNSTFNVYQQGNYWVEITLNNCSITDSILIINNSLTINLGNDTSLCQGGTLTLDATIPNATYLWQNNSTNSTFNVYQQGTYWVEVNLSNCSATDTILIAEEDCEIILEIPNVFTPNNDGSHDLFVPIISKGIFSMNTLIYNRWGNKIFETNNLFIEWNGQDVSNGTYFWIVYYTDINGIENSIKGHVTIFR